MPGRREWSVAGRIHAENVPISAVTVMAEQVVQPAAGSNAPHLAGIVTCRETIEAGDEFVGQPKEHRSFGSYNIGDVEGEMRSILFLAAAATRMVSAQARSRRNGSTRTPDIA
jgi:hypothetical protein